MRLAVVAVVLLAACGDSSAEDTRGTAEPSSTTTTTFDRAAEEAAVIAAYLAQIDAFYLAANPPDPDHPALAETATGPLLEGVRENIAEWRARGIGVRKGEATANNPRVTRITHDAALVEDCDTDADIQFDLASGEVVDDAVLYGRLRARLVKQSGKWLVQSKTTESLAAPCE